MFNLAFASFNNSMNIILSSSVSVILRHLLIVDGSRYQVSFSYSGLDLQALKNNVFSFFGFFFFYRIVTGFEMRIMMVLCVQTTVFTHPSVLSWLLYR